MYSTVIRLAGKRGIYGVELGALVKLSGELDHALVELKASHP